MEIERKEKAEDAPTSTPASEAAEEAELAGEFVALTEAVARDGSVKLRLIGPGWGSSGYYSPAVLKQAAGVFTPGLQMYWDHPTDTEEAERPEGSLRNLAAVLTSDAKYETKGPKGPGLYATANVFEQYRQPLEEMAPHIGVSIRALGKAADGKAEGRYGRIISEIARARSVDFVTAPGAGGRVVEIFEAARVARSGVARSGDRPQQESGDRRQQESGDRRQQDDWSDKENYMDELEKLTKANEALESQLAEAQAQNAQLREALVLREARDVVASTLAEVEMPAVTRTRLSEALVARAVIAEGKLDREATATAVQEAAEAELAYLAEVAGLGRVKDMGGGAPAGGDADMSTRLAEAFRGLGLGEDAAKVAANGR